MNIVLYVSSFLPTLAGREFVVHYIADALQRLGHKVRVVGPAGYWKHRKYRLHYPVHRFPTSKGILPDQLAVTQLLLDTSFWGCDVIHAHNTYPTGYYAARLKRLKRYPLVVTPHGEDILTIPEAGYGLRLRPELNDRIMYALETAELITAVSKRVRDVLAGELGMAEKTRTVLNGVDVNRYSRPSETDIKQWLEVGADARMIVTVGRCHPLKGHEYIIRAMPKVLECEPRAVLVIVGNRTDVLKPLIQDLGLEGKVILTGGISPPMNLLTGQGESSEAITEPDYLAEILGGSELYVSASTGENAEGLSLAVLEAVAAGLPVVATDISGNRDIIKPGENGWLVKPADEVSLAEGIVQILTQREAQQCMRIKARESAMRCDWINIARQYVEVYREAMELNSRQRARA